MRWAKHADRTLYVRNTFQAEIPRGRNNLGDPDVDCIKMDLKGIECACGFGATACRCG